MTKHRLSSMMLSQTIQISMAHKLDNFKNRKSPLTLKSLTSGVFFNISKNEEKKSDLSTCLGATQRVSISAPR